MQKYKFERTDCYKIFGYDIIPADDCCNQVGIDIETDIDFNPDEQIDEIIHHLEILKVVLKGCRTGKRHGSKEQ